MHEKYVRIGNCVGLINSDFPNRGILFYSGFFGDKDESHGLFGDFVPLLHEQGFSTLRFDVSGLGESNPDLSNVDVSSWMEDSYKALDFFGSSGIEKIGLVGFSLGAAFAVLSYSQDPDLRSMIKGLALWAPAFNPQRDMLCRYKENGDYQKSQNGELFKSGKPVSIKILDSLNFDVLDQLENVDCPMLICHSKQDPYIPLSTSRSSRKRIRNLDDFLVVLDSGHSFRSLDDSDNEASRRFVYNKTLDFFKEHLE